MSVSYEFSVYYFFIFQSVVIAFFIRSLKIKLSDLYSGDTRFEFRPGHGGFSQFQ
jgi:hypothetical protein